MPQLSVLPFGLFFRYMDSPASTLQLAACCRDRLQTETYLMAISKVDERKDRPHDVVYSMAPETVATLDDVEVDRLCRVAVIQFLGQQVLGDRSSTIVP